jgi:Xaa-Pro dipeptidase
VAEPQRSSRARVDRVPRPTPVFSEAERKRVAALDAAGPFQTSDPADVRWLLCGGGRPVAAGTSPYAVRLTGDRAEVLYQDIEASRIAAEEPWRELGYEPVAYPWHEAAPNGLPQPDLSALRRSLGPEELERYRRAGSDAAAAFVESLEVLRPEWRELDATAELAGRLHERGFTTPVLLAGGEARAPVHRHPLPTEERLGRFALLAATAERDGLYVSITRLVSFGPALEELRERVWAAAQVDGAVLAASRPGATVGELFDVLRAAYGKLGLRDEWRLHHQGGLTGYAGREVFATPGDRTILPQACGVAWNPSVSGGGKSEDTALVTADGIEVVTRTRELPELRTAAGIPRAGIVEL